MARVAKHTVEGLRRVGSGGDAVALDSVERLRHEDAVEVVHRRKQSLCICGSEDGARIGDGLDSLEEGLEERVRV